MSISDAYLRKARKYTLNNQTGSLGMKIATALSVVILLLPRVPTVYAQVPNETVLEPVDNSTEFLQKPNIPLTRITPEPVVEVKKVTVVKRVIPTQVVPKSIQTGDNSYVRGNCTWYAKSQRPDLPNSLGNARTWYARAKNLGLATSHVPSLGAIVQTSESRLGHVALVTAVGDDTITISEMNYAGFGKISSRVIPIASRFIVGYID